ncbi:MAG: ATP-binding protein [Armatimonadota bacterium]
MSSFRALAVWNAFLATALPLLAFGAFLLWDQQQSALSALDRSLYVATTTAATLLEQVPSERLQAEIEPLRATLGLRLSVIAPDGRVLADTDADLRTLENHADRPEVQDALRTGTGTARRVSDSVDTELRYLARVSGEGPYRRIYRAAAPMSPAIARIRRTQVALGLLVVVVIVVTLALSSRLSRVVVAPVEALSDAAARFAGGDTSARVIPDGPESIARLGGTFNEMAERIDSQVRSLDEAQGFLEAIVRQMPDGLLVLDSRGVITSVNAEAERLLGIPAERAEGRPLLAVLMSYELDREVGSLLEGQPAAPVEVATADGRSLRVSAGPLVVRGAPAGALVIFQDVSELRRADRMRRDFVANVSHELRTPVTAVRAMIETLVLRGARRPELLAEYGERIVQECERMDRLVSDLLLLAETESGQLRLQPEPLTAAEIVEEIVRQVEPVAVETGTRLRVEALPDEPFFADRFATGQCLRNLVDNAIRYASGGEVRIGGRLDDGQVVLYVSDDGPGIPARDLPRIFERFYRVDKARSREAGGTGLGLSIVRHLAESQEGRVWAESVEGRGSTFYLALPRADRDSHSAGGSLRAETESASSSPE